MKSVSAVKFPRGADRQTEASVVRAVPRGRVHRYPADVGAAYPPRATRHIDPGGNVGRNRFTPDARVHPGSPTRC